MLLSVLTGGVFIYSAYTKAFPFYSFEATLVEFVGMPYIMAAISARLFVGIEAAMGLLLALNIYGARNWVSRFAVGLLFIFNLYLIYLWARFGSDVNCGCFGDAVWMNPPVSLLKNVAIMATLWVLIKFNKGISGRWTVIVLGSVSLSLLIIPFIISPIQLDGGNKLELAGWYAGKNVSAAPAIDLRHGKHIVAFLSPSCSHCRKAAKKLHDIHVQYPQASFFMIIGGMESDLDDFWKASGAGDIPYIRMEADTFLKQTSGSFPQIFWIKDGKVVAHTNYKDMKAAAIENWMKN